MGIGRKLDIGFGILVILTLSVVALSYLGGAQATRTIEQTEQLRVPMVLASSQAQANLLSMLASTRGYLALGDQTYRDEYHQAKQAFELNLAMLEKLVLESTSPDDQAHLEQLKSLFKRWSSLPDSLFDLRDDQLKREPALRMLTQDAQPFIVAIIRSVRSMSELQMQREATPENLILLNEIGSYESSFFAILAGLRGYVTTGREGFKFEYNSNLAQNEVVLEKLLKNHENLTQNQQTALDEIIKNRTAFLALPPQMFDIVEGEHAREDLYLFRTEAVPLAQEMIQLLSALTAEQQRALQIDLFQGASGLTNARWQTLIGGMIAVILGIGLAIVLSRNIVGPVKRLTGVVTQIHTGDLSARAEIESHDEIGTLATAFNTMTSQLSQTLKDLDQRRREFREANELLEHRVQERTLELSQANAKLEEKNIALKEMDELKDKFLANTSHELRTPLNGIIGIAESLVDGATGKLSSKTNHNLSMIVSSGRRLASLVDDILDFSKLQHKDLELNIRPIDIRSVTEIVLTLSQPLVGNKNLQLSNKISVDTPLVEADENRLQQIMHNLVGNAIKFTHEGSVTISAETRSQELGDDLLTSDTLLSISYLAITITDTGIGISNDKLKDIFKSFEQAEGSTSREYGGTGLGLTVTKQLVELHNGKIWVESIPNEGSKFIFTLPISETKATLTDKSTSSDDMLLPPSTTSIIDSGYIKPVLEAYNDDLHESAKTILVVDDEPINLQVLTNHLSLQQYRVYQASSGMEAIQAIQGGLKPDLVLLDVMMPKMSGYEVCIALREKYPLAELPILMLTAKTRTKDLIYGFEVGANDYLSKPFDKRELLARVSTLLTLKQTIKSHNTLLILQQELDIAHNIQQSLLPVAKPDWDNLDVVCYSVPAHEVGGDLYTYHVFPPSVAPDTGKVIGGRYGIAIGDVTGKGVPAALLMAISLSSFHSVILHYLDPGTLLAQMDIALRRYTQESTQNCAFVYTCEGHKVTFCTKT